MPTWFPAPLHRALLPLAHAVRHRWRQWRKAPIAGVSVIVTNPAGEILLLRHSYGPDVWALAGGGLAKGEKPAEAARREVHEELGITLDNVPDDWAPIAIMEEQISGSAHTAYVFAAGTDQPPCPDRREVIEARFFAGDNLPEKLGRTTAARLAMWHEWRLSQQA